MGSPEKKLRISVSFAGDDDVVTHALPINEKREVVVANNNNSYLKQVEETDEAETAEIDDAVFKPSEVLTGDKEMTGNEVYGFRTPKKSGRMSQRAAEEAERCRTPKTPKTPKSSLRRNLLIEQQATEEAERCRTPKTPKTPKSSLRRNLLKEQQDVLTPRRSHRAKKETLRKMASSTPHRMHRRNKAENTDSSESEESDDSDVESDSEASEPEREPQKKATVSTPRRRKRRDQQNVPEMTTNVEEYFDLHNENTVTSDHTLARLGTDKMDQDQLSDALSGLATLYIKEKNDLYTEYNSLFNKWMYSMCHGYNLLLYGLGSKRKLLEQFRCDMLEEFTHIVINGYFPSLTIKNILNNITEDIIEHHGSFKSPLEQCHFIKEYYQSGENGDFYLVIHNIDGAMLRSEKNQNVISLLAAIPYVHVVASIDHINAPLIWDQTKSSRFNWLWYDVTTYEPYTDETSYENSLLVQQSGALALSSLQHVMRSLTPNARKIFLLLASHQMDNADNTSYSGLAFPDLYQRCREAFLVNSDLTLRTQLTEFKDHKLIRTKKGLDGMEYLVIPLDGGTLKEFLDQQEDNE